MGNPKINHYNRWRKSVMARDGGKCTQCGTTQKLEAHHIKPFSLFPDDRYDVNNGVILCRACHIKEGHYGAGAKKFKLGTGVL